MAAPPERFYLSMLTAVRLEDGREITREAMFFSSEKLQRSDLPMQLGCEMNEHGGVGARHREATSLPGLFAAGDIVRDLQLVVFAAAQGAKAGVGINLSLLEEDLEERGLGLFS